MAWTVRNEYGALDFETFNELEQAYRLGLVSAEDEVRDPGQLGWRRAGAHPRLMRARAAEKAATSPVPFGFILLAVLIAALSFYLLASGLWALGLIVAMVLATMLMGVTSRAFKLRRA